MTHVVNEISSTDKYMSKMGIKGSSGSKSNYSISKQGSMHISSDTVLNHVQDNKHQSDSNVCDFCQLLTNAYGSPANIKGPEANVIGGLMVLRGQSYC